MHTWNAVLAALFVGACAAGTVEAEPSPPVVVAVGEGSVSEQPAVAVPDDEPARVDQEPDAASRGLTGRDARAAAIAKQLAELEVATLGALGGDSQIADLLGSSDAPGAFLDAAAASAPGVAGGGSVRLGGGAAASPRLGGGATTTSTGGGRLGGLAGAGSAATASTATPSPSRPVGVAQVGTARVTGGAVANASNAVRSLRVRLRRCYQQALERDGTEAGSVTVELDLGSTGEVVTARSSRTQGLAAPTVACVERVGRGAQFAPPEGGASTLEFDVRFVQAP